jgi:hypothetical protein
MKSYTLRPDTFTLHFNFTLSGAGALALEHLSDLAQVVIPMAGNGAHARGKGSRLVSSLLLGAHNDSEVPPRTHQVSTRSYYAPTRLVLVHTRSYSFILIHTRRTRGYTRVHEG